MNPAQYGDSRQQREQAFSQSMSPGSQAAPSEHSPRAIPRWGASRKCKNKWVQDPLPDNQISAGVSSPTPNTKRPRLDEAGQLEQASPAQRGLQARDGQDMNTIITNRLNCGITLKNWAKQVCKFTGRTPLYSNSGLVFFLSERLMPVPNTERDWSTIKSGPMQTTSPKQTIRLL